MARYLRFVLPLVVCFILSTGAFGVLIETFDHIGPGDPGYVGLGSAPYAGSYATWWHDGGAPIAGLPNDTVDVYPDKNHHVGQFTETVLDNASRDSYMRVLQAEQLVSVLPGASYGDIFGQYTLGEFQDLSAATDHYFPPETTGRPVHFHGEDGQSGVAFYDVADEMVVQFFSSDKNDGYIEILVNDSVVGRLDTWCQGWWYFKLSDMNPEVADNVVLRTWFNFDNNASYPSPHINTLDLNSNSQNWLHRMPGDADYPTPDDFHIFFVAYDYVGVPEPATFALVASGIAAIGWLRRRRRRNVG